MSDNIVQHDIDRSVGRDRISLMLKAGASLAAFTVALFPGQSASAQGAPARNLVSACSGVSLPPSAVASILTSVGNGTVTPTENGTNPILGGIGGALPLVPPLGTNAGGVVTNAGAGQPITLQVLNANGTIVGPDDRCDLQADSFGLDTQGGVAIGGDRITGLGTNGLDASAGEAGSIALGNSATTAAGATNAIAIGTGANVNTANSVALGAGSSAGRGALAGYAALGLTGPQASAGEVSVGAVGAERQITNVAAGTAASDAATVGQVAGVAAQLAGLQNGAVQYDGTDRTAVTLAGAGGTTITNVRAGALSATSTDAVNGAQLDATNRTIAALGTAVSNGGAGPVQYANATTPRTPNGGVPTNDLTLVGATAAPVALHNVAAGAVAPGSTDAVNGGQVYAIGQNAVNAVTYDTNGNGVRSNRVTLAGGSTAAPVAIGNVAAGVSGTDAVNVSQLTSSMNSAVGQANAYTDSRFNAVSFDIRQVRRDAYAGSAGALAAAGLPQAYEAGKGMIALAGGTYMNASAVALGFSKAFNDGHTVVKLAGSYDSRSRAGASGGIGYQF